MKHTKKSSLRPRSLSAAATPSLSLPSDQPTPETPASVSKFATEITAIGELILNLNSRADDFKSNVTGLIALLDQQNESLLKYEKEMFEYFNEQLQDLKALHAEETSTLSYKQQVQKETLDELCKSNVSMTTSMRAMIDTIRNRFASDATESN